MSGGGVCWTAQKVETGGYEWQMATTDGRSSEFLAGMQRNRGYDEWEAVVLRWHFLIWLGLE